MPSINEYRTITVRAEGDSTSYVRATDAATASTKKFVAAGNEANVTLKETERKLNDTGSAADKFKRVWVDGVRDIQGYNKAIRDLNRFHDTKKISDREFAIALDNINRKFSSVTNTIVDNTRAMHNSGQGSAQMQRGMLGATQQSRAMQFAVQNLGFQINDVATQLASGTGVFQVFAQQAGQFVQVFQQGGGIRNVLSEFGATASRVFTSIASVITPARAGLVLLGAGVSAALIKAVELEGQTRSLNVALRGMGTSSLESAAGLQKQVEQFRAMGVAADEARAAIDKITRTPGINPAQAVAVARTGANLGAARGTGVEGGTEELLMTIRGGSQAILKLGLELEKITPQEAALNSELRIQKGELAAVEQAFGLLSSRLDGLHKAGLSPLAEAFIDARNAFNDFITDLSKTGGIQFLLDEFKGVLAGIKTTINEIKAVRDFIQSIPKPTPQEGAYNWRDESNANVLARNPRAGNYPTVGTTYGTGALGRLIPSMIQSESEFKPNAVSPKGAIGLMQIMPSTARDLGLSNPFDPEANIEAGSRYIRQLVDQFGNLNDALMAYNWGQGHMRSALAGRKAIPSSVREYASTITSRAGLTGLETSADLQEPVFRASAVEVAKYDETLKKLNVTGEDAIRIASAHAAAREAVTAQVQAERIAIDAGLGKARAEELGRQAYTLSIERSRIEIEKETKAQDLHNKGLVATTEAFRVSAAEGYRAAAAEQARAESMQKAINVTQRTQQILEEQAATAVLMATQQATASRQQITGLERLAEATAQSEAAAHEVDIENRASLRTQDALAKAEASRVPGLIDQAKALNDVAIADEKRIDAAQRSIRVNQAANDNLRTAALVNLETSLQGLPREQMERQLELARAVQQLERDRVPLTSASAQNYLRTVDAIGQARIRLVEAQREQQRWDDMVRSMASTVEDVLGSAFEDIFSGKKINDWGDRLRKMLNSLASEMARSLLLRPLFDDVARYMSGLFSGGGGLGGLFGGGGGLGGAALAGGAGIAGGSVLVATQGGGVVNLGTLANGASLASSLGGGSMFGGVGNWINNFGTKLGFSAGGAGGLSPYDALGYDVLGLTTGGGSLFGNLTLTSALKNVGLGTAAGSLLNSVMGGNTLTGTIGSGLGSLAGTLIPSMLGMSLGPIGGLVGGALGSLLGQLGNNRPSNFSSGAFVNLASGGISGFASSGNAQNDAQARQISESISEFSRSIQKLTGGTINATAYINPDVGSREGIQLNYSLVNKGSGTLTAGSAEEAINVSKLAIARELEGVSDTIRTVIESVTDPNDIEAAVQAATAYENLSDAFKEAFASLPTTEEIKGPYAQARDQLQAIFNELSENFQKFGLSLEPVNAALIVATEKLKGDFKESLDALLYSAEGRSWLNDLEALFKWRETAWSDAQAIGMNTQAVMDQINQINYLSLTKTLSDKTSQDLQAFISVFGGTRPEMIPIAQSLLPGALEREALPNQQAALAAQEQAATQAAATQATINDFVEEIRAAGWNATGQGFMAELRKVELQRQQMNTRAAELGIPMPSYGIPEFNLLAKQQWTDILRDKTVEDLQAVVDGFKIIDPYLSDFARTLMATAKTVAEATSTIADPLRDLRESLLSGELSGKTEAMIASAANDNFRRAILAVRGGDDTRIGEAAQYGQEAIRYSMQAYGNAPQTAQYRQGIISAIDEALSARGFAGGTSSTPPGWVRYGELGPEWVHQPGGATVLPSGTKPSMVDSREMAALLRQLTILVSAGNRINQAALSDVIKAIFLANKTPPIIYKETRAKAA